MVVVERVMTVVNDLGLHARPAGEFVKVASRFESDVWVAKDGEPVNGKAVKPNSISVFSRLDVEPGTSTLTIKITDAAVYLVLYCDDEELRRVAIEGVPGEIVSIRP